MKTISISFVLYWSITTALCQTNVGGTLSGDAHWTLAGSPYNVTSTLGVPSGITLTIDPGVVVNGNNFSILVKGKILVNGTEAQRVSFVTAWLEFTGADLALSTVQGSQFSNSAGLKVGSEIEFFPANPKNTNTLTVKKSLFPSATYIFTEGYQSSAKLRLEECTFTSSHFQGFEGSERIEIDNSAITSTTFIASSNYVGMDLSNSSISSSTFSILSNSSIRLVDCTLANTPFTTDPANSGNTVEMTRVTATNSFIDLQFGTVTITDCSLSVPGTMAASTMIRMGGGSILTSTLQGKSGLTLVQVHGNSTIQGVNFKNFDVGILVTNVTIGVISNNNFLSGSTYVIRNQAAGNVDAQNNYWGTADEQVIKDKIYDYYDNLSYGIVNYAGFASSPVATNPLPVPSILFKGEQNDGNTLVRWAKVSSPNVVGYKIYKKQGGAYTLLGNAGNVSSFNVNEDVAQDFVITSYNSVADGIDDQLEGAESPYSTVSIPFVTINNASTTQCSGTELQIGVTQNFSFASGFNFYLITSLTENFADSDTVKIIPSGGSTAMIWLLPTLTTLEKQFFYRLASDEVPVFSNTKTINVTQSPSIDFSAAVQDCAGIKITFIGITTDMEVNWSTDGGTMSDNAEDSFMITWPSTGEKTVNLTVSKNGCQGTTTKKISFILYEKLQTPVICTVEFDEPANANKISWQYTNSRLADFNLYRETSLDQYTLIATLPATAETYLDESSVPFQRAYRYKLAAVDVCEKESDLSEPVQSFHLQLGKGINSAWNLTWEQPSESGRIEIYKKSEADWEKIADLASVHTSFTDLDNSIKPAYYQAIVVKSISSCYVKSNIVYNGYTGLEEALSGIKIYPNPAVNEIGFEVQVEAKYLLLNSQGLAVKNGIASPGTHRLAIEDLLPGMYVLKIKLSNKTLTAKVIKRDSTPY